MGRRLGLGSGGQGQVGSSEGDSRGTPRGSLHRPLPCLLDEADDEFAHFNRLIYLESDDLLPTSGRRRQGRARTHPLTLPTPSLSHQSLTSRKLSRSVGSLLMISSWTCPEIGDGEEEHPCKTRSCRCRQERVGGRSTG